MRSNSVEIFVALTVPYFSGSPPSPFPSLPSPHPSLPVSVLSQKEAVVKKEEEKRKQLMKDQRQKTIQRVKQYMEVKYQSHSQDGILMYQSHSQATPTIHSLCIEVDSSINSLEPRLSVLDFVSQLFLQSCETKFGTENLGLRLEQK